MTLARPGRLRDWGWVWGELGECGEGGDGCGESWVSVGREGLGVGRVG